MSLARRVDMGNVRFSAASTGKPESSDWPRLPSLTATASTIQARHLVRRCDKLLLSVIGEAYEAARVHPHDGCRASTSLLPGARRTWMAGTSPAMTKNAAAGFSVRAKTNFTRPFKPVRSIHPLTRKNFACAVGQISGPSSPVLLHKRGVSRSSRTLAAGCDGRVGFTGRVKREADGKSVWSWSPDAGIKLFRETFRERRRWQQSPVHRGERAISRKPSCRECRNVSAYLW